MRDSPSGDLTSGLVVIYAVSSQFVNPFHEDGAGRAAAPSGSARAGMTRRPAKCGDMGSDTAVDGKTGGHLLSSDAMVEFAIQPTPHGHGPVRPRDRTYHESPACPPLR